MQILVNDRRGHGATEDLLGNRLSAQENYGGEYTRLTGVQLPAQSVFCGRVCQNRLHGDGYRFWWHADPDQHFVSAGFCAHPLTMSSGSGWGNYPTAHWGGELRYDVNDSLTLQTAVFRSTRSTTAFPPKRFPCPATTPPGPFCRWKPSSITAPFSMANTRSAGAHYDGSKLAKNWQHRKKQQPHRGLRVDGPGNLEG